jgi:hypothetical protein
MAIFKSVNVAVNPDPAPPIVATVALTEAELQQYWTPSAKTPAERSAACTKFTREFNTAMNAAGGYSSLRQCNIFTLNLPTERRIEPMEFNIDHSTWRRTSPVQMRDALVKHFKFVSLTDPRIRHTDICTTMMFEGVEIKIYHLTESVTQQNVGVDSGGIGFLFGYNGARKVFEILLNRFGFELDENAIIKYKLRNGSEIFKEYTLLQSLEATSKFLGLPTKNGNNPYYGFHSLNALVNWFMSSKYIGKSTFYIDDANEYVGPEDYFESQLFKEIVQNIQTRYANNSDKNTPDVLPETITKYQMKYWQEVRPTEYRQMILDAETFQRQALIGEKYNSEIIREITGLTSATQLSAVIKRFEQKAEKTGLEFFVLSASEDTIRQRLIECKQEIVGAVQ